MATKMKGIFKGIKHISQIFVYKDHEMEIGYPTDVKHVAHIGWDGGSTNAPSWMNEFKTVSDFSTSTLNNIGQSRAASGVAVAKLAAPDSQQSAGFAETPGIFLDSHYPTENPLKKSKRKKPKSHVSVAKAKRSSSNRSSPSSSRHSVKLRPSSALDQEEFNISSVS